MVDGPFAETKELVAGYTLIEVGSREEALAWTKRFPNPASEGKDGEIEVRQLFELEDFGESESIVRFRAMGVGARITPFLWFDDNAEEAVKFYTSIFENSRIVSVARYGDAGARASGKPKGSVMTVAFELEGQPFVALNGGPVFTFTPAISFVVNCGTQEEIDALWEKLSEGGAMEQCGWLRDRYGVSWQVVPSVIGELMSDPAKSENVMQALLQMTKIDIAGLKRASGQ